jgi:polyferredoxin
MVWMLPAFAIMLAVTLAAAAAARRAPAAARPYPRLDLAAIPALARLLRWPPFLFLLRLPLVVLFVGVILAGLLGEQSPGRNLATITVWTVWWAALPFLALAFGKVWCAVCPWQALADWAQRLRLWGATDRPVTFGLSVPPWLRNLWPAIALFLVLTWLELGFGITLSPRITAYLALAMVFLALYLGLVFARAAFCRYGCLVGAITGIYATFAPVELRGRDRAICRGCAGRDCYHGNALGNPCPTFQYLGGMERSSACLLCLECTRSCPEANVAVSLRPFGAELAALPRPRRDEAWLALILVGLTTFHGFVMTPWWARLAEGAEAWAGLGPTAAFTALMAVAVSLPIGAYAGVAALARVWGRGGAQVARAAPFTQYAFALLPVAFFYHLAHNAGHLFLEGGALLPALSDPLGWGWNLFGTADILPGPLLAGPPLVALQVACLVVGQAYAALVALRVSRRLFAGGRPALALVPVLVFSLLLSGLNLWLLGQPMVHRTGL